jgi:hypothetical protein
LFTSIGFTAPANTENWRALDVPGQIRLLRTPELFDGPIVTVW